MGELARAQSHLERALTIWRQAFEANHPEVAAGLNNLGILLRDAGELDQAQSCFEKTASIWEKGGEPAHFQQAHALNNLGALHCLKGDFRISAVVSEASAGNLQQFIGTWSCRNTFRKTLPGGSSFMSKMVQHKLGGRKRLQRYFMTFFTIISG
jgi:tetratricopeptide (TPR) repeat protein